MKIGVYLSGAGHLFIKGIDFFFLTEFDNGAIEFLSGPLSPGEDNTL